MKLQTKLRLLELLSPILPVVNFVMRFFGFPSAREAMRIQRLVDEALFGADAVRERAALDLDAESFEPEINDFEQDDDIEASECIALDMSTMHIYQPYKQGWLVVHLGWDFDEPEDSDPGTVNMYWVHDDTVFAASDSAQALFPHLPHASHTICSPDEMRELTAKYQAEFAEQQ